jgi:hypothetical protein
MVMQATSFVSLGFWPADTRGTVFFEFSFMLYLSTLQHFSPALSMQSMLQALLFICALECKVGALLYTKIGTSFRLVYRALVKKLETDFVIFLYQINHVVNMPNMVCIITTTFRIKHSMMYGLFLLPKDLVGV